MRKAEVMEVIGEYHGFLMWWCAPFFDPFGMSADEYMNPQVKQSRDKFSNVFKNEYPDTKVWSNLSDDIEVSEELAQAANGLKKSCPNIFPNMNVSRNRLRARYILKKTSF